jgi:hypothetical protein
MGRNAVAGNRPHFWVLAANFTEEQCQASQDKSGGRRFLRAEKAIHRIGAKQVASIG